MGLTFRDAKRVEREVRYIYYWPPVENHPGYTHALLLGKEVPHGGREEQQAFLGLLQRWYRGDDEARGVVGPRPERRDPSLRANSVWLGWPHRAPGGQGRRRLDDESARAKKLRSSGSHPDRGGIRAMPRIVRGGLIQATLCEPTTSPVAKIRSAMVDKHVALIAEAAGKGAEVVCLQELFYGPLLLRRAGDEVVRPHRARARRPDGPIDGRAGETSRDRADRPGLRGGAGGGFITTRRP